MSGCACWLRQHVAHLGLVASVAPHLCLSLGRQMAVHRAARCRACCTAGLGCHRQAGGPPPPGSLTSTRGFLAIVSSLPFLPSCSLGLAAGLPKPLLGRSPPFPAGRVNWGHGRGCCPTGEDPQLGHHGCCGLLRVGWDLQPQASSAFVEDDRPCPPPQPREKGRMRFHKLQNVQIALDYLRHRQVRLPAALPLTPHLPLPNPPLSLLLPSPTIAPALPPPCLARGCG